MKTSSTTKSTAYPILTCAPKSLPEKHLIKAAATAVKINPLNHAPVDRLMRVMKNFVPEPLHIALVTSKYWGAAGVKLTVGFLDNPPTALRKRILLHMNAWAKTANVSFVESKTSPQVRISRSTPPPNDGYWSYVGTDILHIPAGQPTMNLQDFTMKTPESEYHRVIRHETGHTLGFPHEHMRKELVNLIDPNKAIPYFMQTQGWTKNEVIAQVLTPLKASTLTATPHADPNSIMCYQIPGTLTKSGQPIIGGIDIDPTDYAFAKQVYPK